MTYCMIHLITINYNDVDLFYVTYVNGIYKATPTFGTTYLKRQPQISNISTTFMECIASKQSYTRSNKVITYLKDLTINIKILSGLNTQIFIFLLNQYK